MSLQNLFALKRLAAVVALEGADSGVLQHVILQVYWLFKRITASVTLVFSLITVTDHVSRQTNRRLKAFGAFCTFEWSVFRVCKHMNPFALDTFVEFSTNLARKLHGWTVVFINVRL